MYAIIVIQKTELPHIYNHSVTEKKVEDILLSPGENRPGRDGSRIAVGRSPGGRYLKVIYVSDPEPGSVFVITAYKLTGKALKAYRKRKRRKQ